MLSKKKRVPRKNKENVVLQKRKVIAVKVFMTPEEKIELEKRACDFSSISNFIRHRLGFSPNNTGRKKSKNRDAKVFDLGDTEIENMLNSIFS